MEAKSLNPNAVITVDASKCGVTAMSTPQEEEDEPCDHLYYEVDTPTCVAVTKRRGKRAGALCHASAAARYAACKQGKPLPPLIVWNN